MKKTFVKEKGKVLKFLVFEDVYEPAEDSLLFLSSLPESLEGKILLEIGSGSGVISVITALRGARVTAVDVNPKAVENTLLNAEKHGVRVDAFESNLFEKVKRKFDVIIFNPPYVPTEPGEEKDLLSLAWDGGPKGTKVIERFLKQFKEHLKDKGECYLLISSKNGLRKELEKQGWKTVNSKHLFFEELYVMEYEKKY